MQNMQNLLIACTEISGLVLAILNKYWAGQKIHLVNEYIVSVKMKNVSFIFT